MADLTITTTAIIPGATATIKTGIAGAVILPGKPVYLDPDTSTIKIADSNDADVDVRTSIGISVNSAVAIGQPISYIKDGTLGMGAILTKGVTYCLSDTAGGICPQADVGAGEEVVILGVASSTANLEVGLRDTGIVI